MLERLRELDQGWIEGAVGQRPAVVFCDGMWTYRGARRPLGGL